MAAVEGRILVGLDGSERGRVAARWAAAWAEQLSCALTLVAVLPEVGRGGMAALQQADALKSLRGEVVTHLAEVRTELTGSHAGLEVAELVESGMPASVLVRLAESAPAVVIGTRGLRGFRAMALGAVADHVVTHAHAPVVVVPGTADLASGGAVAVGVDGSPESLRALTVAAEEAARRRRRLQVISVWDGGGHMPYARVILDQIGEAQAVDPDGVIAAAVSAAERDHPGLTVERVIGQGRAAEVLVRASRPACLLVVASRGRGTFPGMVLGSTSRAVAQHSECPVLVVRDRG